jgi:predicted amidohydrolase
MSALALALLELPARFGRVGEALADVEALVARAPADLVLLPEASLTGYVSPRGDFDLRPLAEERGGSTERALARIAREHRVHLAAPLIEREKDAWYNSFLIFDRSGAVIASYRKRHPWYPERWATPSPAPAPVFAIDGWAVTIAICFDVHTLADESADALERADLLLFPSAWCEDEGQDLRAELLPPLAARFGVAIANANWAAGDVRLPGQGASRAWDRTGALVACASGPRLDVRLERSAR